MIKRQIERLINGALHAISTARVFQAKRLVKHIMITHPCNVDPLTSHFYILKLGFTGVYIFFLCLHQNIDCGYPLEPPHLGGSNVYP